MNDRTITAVSPTPRTRVRTVASPSDNLGLRRALGTTLMGLARSDALDVEGLHRKVVLICADLDDALNHLDQLDRFIPCGNPVGYDSSSRLEQRAPIVYLCTEIVAFTVAGIAARLSATGAHAFIARRRLQSMRIPLEARLQLLVRRWRFLRSSESMSDSSGGEPPSCLAPRSASGNAD